MKHVKKQTFYKLCKTCKIKYGLFCYKSCETNLSFIIINLSCFSKNIYLHINPTPIVMTMRDVIMLKKNINIEFLK